MTVGVHCTVGSANSIYCNEVEFRKSCDQIDVSMIIFLCIGHMEYLIFCLLMCVLMFSPNSIVKCFLLARPLLVTLLIR